MSNFFNRFNQSKGEVTKPAGFGVIPGGTIAMAVIIKAELRESKYGMNYSFAYKLLDGDFKGRVIFHKVRVFDEDEKKADRHMDMFKKLYTICGVEMTCSGDYPQNQDLIGFVNKTIIIETGIWEMIGNDDEYREGNWIQQVEAPTGDHVPVTGTEFNKGEAALRGASQPVVNPMSAPTTQFVPQQQAPAMQANPDLSDSIPF
jgi:hypothetical protein